MFESEEVDEDYFTPSSNTTLANIFNNTPQSGEEKENASLKYTPKPQNFTPKPEEAKTQCIMACTVFGYGWFEGVYESKGKLGLAILKIHKTDCHNLVIYDSNKATVSCTTISPNLHLNVQGVYISYYDNLRKYWSLYATQEEVRKIIEILKTLSVTIKYSPHRSDGPPEPTIVKHPKVDEIIDQPDKADKESDTDSSLNRKTKASILSRMANMGHSILPPQPVERTSDSSDNETYNYNSKALRHKAIKNIGKRNIPEKSIIENQNSLELKKNIKSKTELNEEHDASLYTCIRGQLVPVTNTGITGNPSINNVNDMSLFMSEQRINNSEVRINLSRMHDKVDTILDKVKDLEHTEKSNTLNFQNEILQKLLNEYEAKIKKYEEIIKDTRSYSDDITEEKLKGMKDEIKSCTSKIFELEQQIKVKDIEILNLHNSIALLKKEYEELNMKKANNEINLNKEIKTLEEILVLKNEELANMTIKYNNVSLPNVESHNDTENQIKSIMNDTFQAITKIFENNENYSGDIVKSRIAAVIRKITIKSINNLQIQVETKTG